MICVAMVLRCAARHGGAQRIGIIVRGVWWCGSICQVCFGHDGFSTDGASTRLEDSSNISAAVIIVRTWWRKLRPGNSTKSAIDQCAHRVIRIQNNGQTAALHVAVIGNVGSTTQQSLWFREFEFTEHKGALLLTQSLLQTIAFRVAMQPSDNCT